MNWQQLGTVGVAGGRVWKVWFNEDVSTGERWCASLEVYAEQGGKKIVEEWLSKEELGQLVGYQLQALLRSLTR